MEFGELRRNWNDFGRTDPLWAILTVPGKRHGGWDPDEFFRAGQTEIERVMQRVDKETNGSRPVRHERALDFGCGAGRLTQALTAHFESVVGVDIAPSMIDLAREYDRSSGKCSFVLLQGQDLSELDDESFDFVYTAHVLQHMQPRYARRYVAEFVRVLRPDGCAFIEIPTRLVPGLESALPPSAFRARVELPIPPRELVAGGMHAVEVVVTNDSPAPWRAPRDDGSYVVAIGNHWRTAEGDVVAFDDGRSALPIDLSPGASCTATLYVQAPATPGKYELEVDLVLEAVAWFAQRGSPTTKCAVVVTPRGGDAEPVAPEGLGSDLGPTMQMYGTPEHVVQKWVRESGGSVMSVLDWDELTGTKSADWERRGYIVRRGPTATTGWRSLLGFRRRS